MRSFFVTYFKVRDFVLGYYRETRVMERKSETPLSFQCKIKSTKNCPKFRKRPVTGLPSISMNELTNAWQVHMSRPSPCAFLEGITVSHPPPSTQLPSPSAK